MNVCTEDKYILVDAQVVFLRWRDNQNTLASRIACPNIISMKCNSLEMTCELRNENHLQRKGFEAILACKGLSLEHIQNSIRA